ncbi:MAG: hypothetical protein RRY99_09800 [Flavobacterium sp.]
MNRQNVNEDFLLLLIEKEGLIDTATIHISNHFEEETLLLTKLCRGDSDNILQIIRFIRDSLKPKLPNKIFNYCKGLDKAYQSVIINVEESIRNILTKRDLIYSNQNIAKIEKREFDLPNRINNLKKEILEQIILWFRVFNIEFAYEEAKKNPDVLVYSHRISGWSAPEYQITKNLKQQVKTNFGYGSVSYFYSLLTFKNIQISPLSEWIDYRYSNFSEVTRYTKSFRSRIAVTDSENRIRYYKTKIENSYWLNALDFTKRAANLSITNEKEFVEKYIISECEKMVNGLEIFYTETKFDFIDENQVDADHEEIIINKVDINGYELIDFRTEKIIGALDFISKISDYNAITPTGDYSEKIKLISRKFIPNVYRALDQQKIELKTAKERFNVFIKKHNKLIAEQRFYKNEMVRLQGDFEKHYKEKYHVFFQLFTQSSKELVFHDNKIKLHSDNVDRLVYYIKKYREIIKE